MVKMKVDRNIIASSLWWVILGLDVFSLAILVTVLPRRLRNGLGIHVAASVLLKAAGVKVHAEGLENVDKNQPQIFVANHQSWFDSFVLSATLPVQLTFASKKEMYRVPIYSYIMRRMHFICVDRGHPKDALKNIDAIAGVIRSGLSLVAYPEGFLSKTGELGPFKRGAVLLASKAGLPIVPITLLGTREIMAPGSWRINFGRHVKVTISKPVEAGGTGRKEQTAATEKIRRLIAENLECSEVPEKVES